MASWRLVPPRIPSELETDPHCMRQDGACHKPLRTIPALVTWDFDVSWGDGEEMGQYKELGGGKRVSCELKCQL